MLIKSNVLQETLDNNTLPLIEKASTILHSEHKIYGIKLLLFIIT